MTLEEQEKMWLGVAADCRELMGHGQSLAIWNEGGVIAELLHDGCWYWRRVSDDVHCLPVSIALAALCEFWRGWCEKEAGVYMQWHTSCLWYPLRVPSLGTCFPGFRTLPEAIMEGIRSFAAEKRAKAKPTAVDFWESGAATEVSNGMKRLSKSGLLLRPETIMTIHDDLKSQAMEKRREAP
jgi:hypothetical protein